MGCRTLAGLRVSPSTFVSQLLQRETDICSGVRTPFQLEQSVFFLNRNKSIDRVLCK